jgi:hypothetical protein
MTNPGCYIKIPGDFLSMDKYFVSTVATFWVGFDTFLFQDNIKSRQAFSRNLTVLKN